MHKLLKADFFALFKSKVTWIALGLSVGIPILFALFDYGIAHALFDGVEDVNIRELYSARDIMFGNFNLSSNIGLVIPMFAGILSIGDVRNGTVRNKIIIGHSRVKIYLSQLIVATAFCVTLGLLAFAFSGGTALIFFNYGEAFKGAALGYFFKCLLVGILAFVFAASVSTFMSLVTKNMALTIIFTLLVFLFLGLMNIVSSVLIKDSNKYLFYLMPTYVSNKFSSFSVLSIFSQGKFDFTKELFWCGIGSFIGFTAINTGLGMLIFSKVDLK